MTFRFNRDKRIGVFTHAEFMDAAKKLIAIVRKHRPGITAEIRTYESTNLAGKYPNAAFLGDRAMETDDCFAYPVDRFGEDTWKRIYDAEVHIDDPRDSRPFDIRMGCSRRPTTKRLYFYGQLVEESLFAEIYKEFGTPSFNVTIGQEIDRKSVIGTKEPRRVA